MNQAEIRFLKHCLQDHKYCEHMMHEAISRKKDLWQERNDFLLNTGSVIKVPDKNQQFEDPRLSEEWAILTDKIEQAETEEYFYSNRFVHTESMIRNIPEPLQGLLRSLYEYGEPPNQVAYKYGYSDEKVLYRYIRNQLRKL